MMRLADALVMLLSPPAESPLAPVPDTAWNHGLTRYTEEEELTEPDSAPSRRFDEDEDTVGHKLSADTALLLAEAAGGRGDHDAQKAYLQYANRGGK